MLKRWLLLLLVIVRMHTSACAVEGMWIPLFLDSLNIRHMQEMGLRLSAGDIYSVNQASLKDAVVIFGGGCTGAVISPDGLLITNHHCGDSRIQAHSTVKNNLLKNGFWALNREDELPNPGLTATFLVKIEDVTEAVLFGISEFMSEAERDRLISASIEKVLDAASVDTHYFAEVNSFYFGMQYLLFVYETFKDVRLVGAPPEDIGNFGGNTDNWVWPRHTGDFSLFRIYSDKNNKPAEYSQDNIPYKPKKHFQLSLKGLKEGDFTMVIGYPGNTDEYMMSEELRLIVEKCLPAKIQMRDLKLSLLESEMNKSDEARLMHSITYSNISNSWKKWIGVVRGIQNSRAIDEKNMLEKRFVTWSKRFEEDRSQYHGIIERYNEIFDQYEPLYAAYDIGTEMLSNLETFSMLNRTLSVLNGLPDTSSRSFRKEWSRQLTASIRNFYKSHPVEMDRELLPSYLQIYRENTAAALQPDFYNQIDDRFQGNYHAFVNDLYDRSFFADTVELFRLFRRSSDVIVDRIVRDPFHQMYYQFNKILTEQVNMELAGLSFEYEKFYRNWLKGLIEMDADRLFYPDANFTMRITYGKIDGYDPSDAVEYDYFTTIDGIFEKEDTEIQDYTVTQSLKDVYATGDFGKYAVGQLIPVCFIASNHTSGGNSGSPVLNADGHLVGINFDRNWEGTMSDYAYDPDICRNISLDIRYVLFILDKLAHAQKILNELTIVE